MVVGETLYDKAAGLYPLLREIGAPCLFFGGGTIVNDEIQAAANLRLYSLYLAEGPGASARHAQLHPQRSFRSATELFGLLQQPGQWQGPPDPYWHLGPNPTVDLVLVRGAPAGPGGEVLLIRRDADARAEPDRWALPGGFPHTEAPRGALWEPGAETLAEACLRELREETGLDLAGRERELEFLGEYEGDGRDPRDTSEAWSHSTVFLYRLPDELAGSPLVGGDDAADARWFPLCRLPRPLAFDHARILTDAIRRLTRGP
ncbi:MAG: NUDIX hydrolase [Armatimonadetes bacterium]|nr:NUDIX hydrolase [Armatimonadota bacterium]